MHREIREITDFKTQIDLTDMYRIFRPNRKEYTFFLGPHGTFSKIGHILSNKRNLHKCKKIGITQCILSDHHGLQVNSCLPFLSIRMRQVKGHLVDEWALTSVGGTESQSSQD